VTVCVEKSQLSNFSLTLTFIGSLSKLKLTFSCNRLIVKYFSAVNTYGSTKIVKIMMILKMNNETVAFISLKNGNLSKFLLNTAMF